MADSIAALVVTLIGFGAVFVFSASARVGADYDWKNFYNYLELRQLFFCILAIAVMLAVSLFNYKWLAFKSVRPSGLIQNPLSWLLLISIALLVIVLIPGLGTEVNYARRWLRVPAGPITINFQPSELAKWALVFFLSAVSAKLGEKLRLFKKSFLPLIILIGLVLGLIIIEDFGTTAFLGAISFTILLVAGAKWWHFITPIPVLAGVLTLAIIKSPERIERITAFLSPTDASSQAAGYQVEQSLTAISTGGLLGKGLGRGISKYGHLPEDTTDFIFAIVAEEMGFIGVVAVVLLFILFIILGVMTIHRCRDNFGRLLAFAIVLTIASQAAINLGVVTRLLPTKGIALPFISAGGSHLLLAAAAVGILINITRNSSGKTQ
ncbi:MAG: putative lipid II flippase FtsW [Anaerohalosphaeraceae bacterium]|nr:putative lipid II flippase FtsW [Anaerohalosphaeraceae bacterium]